MKKLLDAISGISRLTLVPIMSVIEREIEFEDDKYVFDGDSNVGVVLAQLFNSVGNSTGTLISVAKLSEENYSGKDCLTIARGIIECTVNISYIMAVGKDAANAAIEHSIARGYKNTNKVVGNDKFGMRVKRIPEIKLNGHLTEIVDKFTSKKGKPKNWNDLSVHQRIERVEEDFGGKLASSLGAAFLMVYGDASEVIHGTLAGAQIGNGTIAFAKFPREDNEHLAIQKSHAENSLMAAFIALHTVLEVFIVYSKNDNLKKHTDKYLNLFASYRSAQKKPPDESEI